MKITSIDRATLNLIQERVSQAVMTLGDELGVKFTYKGGTYGAAGMIKLGVEVQDTGNGKSSTQIAYERLCPLLDLKPEWFGKTFWTQGRQYRLIGTNSNSPKYALTIQRVADGKTFKATAQMVKSGFEIEISAGRIAA